MTRKLGWILLATALAVPSIASAQGTAGANVVVSAEDQARAQQHFQRAKELYSAGSYRDAITELESARTLDPKAKELVFNLGIVHEKLARFDEAIGFFQKYLEMEGLTAAERAKAESIIKRIEGAKHEVPKVDGGGVTPPPPGPGETLGGPVTNEKPPEPERGRVDVWTIAAGSVAVVGLGVGTVFGINALATRPTRDFVTGRDGSYAQVVKDTDDAHSAAVVADVGLGIGLVAAVATAILYFGRTKDAPPTTGTRVVPSAAPAASGAGATFMAVGTF